MKSPNMMLPILIAVLLGVAGCGGPHGMMGREHGEGALERGTEEMNRLVEQTVKDPDKAKQVQTILQDIKAEVRQSAQQTRGYHEQLYVLNSDYQAKPEQFTKVLDELNNARMTSATKILAMRYKIKDLLTAQEWKDLTDAMAKSRVRYEHKEHKPGM
jgi:hypothetical protein